MCYARIVSDSGTQSPSRVLVVGRNAEMMVATLARLEAEGMRAVGRFTDAEAIATAVETPVELVVIAGGVETKETLKRELAERCPGLEVIVHFGGPRGLLDAVRAALTR